MDIILFLSFSASLFLTLLVFDFARRKCSALLTSVSTLTVYYTFVVFQRAFSVVFPFYFQIIFSLDLFEVPNFVELERFEEDKLKYIFADSLNPEECYAKGEIEFWKKRVRSSFFS